MAAAGSCHPLGTDMGEESLEAVIGGEDVTAPRCALMTSHHRPPRHLHPLLSVAGDGVDSGGVAVAGVPQFVWAPLVHRR